MRICLVYDCLFPYTVGGAERWYRALAQRLAAQGHEVTYLTLRQWDRGTAPDLPSVRVRTAGPRMALYSGPGQRRILPPLVFGLGVLVHLLRHGRRYDVVHSSSFPFFSLLAAAAVRPLHGFRLVVDWVEFWTRDYWRDYLGRAGVVGFLVQRACIRLRQRAFCYAQLTARRLRAEGLRGEVTVLRGLYDGAVAPPVVQPAGDEVVFAGRHIPEKGAPAVVAGVLAARDAGLAVRGAIFGDGPERAAVLAAIGDSDAVRAPGFAPAEELESAMGRALCLLHPSRREGYGLVVVEAASRGVPTILVAHPDNAATELVADGVNGFVVPDDQPATLAAAIRRVLDAGPELRRSTADWFTRTAPELSVDASLDVVVGSYGG